MADLNLWLLAAGILILGLVPCGWVLIRGKPVDGLIALELAGTVTTLAFLLLAQGLSRPAFFDLALTLAILAFPAGLVFAHFLERWL